MSICVVFRDGEAQRKAGIICENAPIRIKPNELNAFRIAAPNDVTESFLSQNGIMPAYLDDTSIVGEIAETNGPIKPYVDYVMVKSTHIIGGTIVNLTDLCEFMVQSGCLNHQEWLLPKERQNVDPMHSAIILAERVFNALRTALAGNGAAALSKFMIKNVDDLIMFAPCIGILIGECNVSVKNQEERLRTLIGKDMFVSKSVALKCRERRWGNAINFVDDPESFDFSIVNDMVQFIDVKVSELGSSWVKFAIKKAKALGYKASPRQINNAFVLSLHAWTDYELIGMESLFQGLSNFNYEKFINEYIKLSGHVLSEEARFKLAKLSLESGNISALVEGSDCNYSIPADKLIPVVQKNPFCIYGYEAVDILKNLTDDQLLQIWDAVVDRI